MFLRLWHRKSYRFVTDMQGFMFVYLRSLISVPTCLLIKQYAKYFSLPAEKTVSLGPQILSVPLNLSGPSESTRSSC